MKSFLISSLSLIWAFTMVSAQHQILLLDGSSLENVQLHDIKTSHIVYEQYGSLHDLQKSLIYQIRTDTQVFIFNDEGKLVSMTYPNQTKDVEKVDDIAPPILEGDTVDILFHDKRPKEGVQLYRYKAWSITYRKGNNLHDVFKKDIHFINSDSSRLYFREDGSMRYEAKFKQAPQPDPIPEPQPEPDLIPDDKELETPSAPELVDTTIQKKEAKTERNWEDTTFTSKSGRLIDLGRTDHTAIVFLTPTALLDPMNSILGGVELRLTRHVSFVGELGYVFGAWREFGSDWKLTRSGITAQSAMRLYGKKPRRLLFVTGRMFIETELVYKHATFPNSDWYEMSRFGVNMTLGSQRVLENGQMIETYLGVSSLSVLNVGVKIGLAK